MIPLKKFSQKLEFKEYIVENICFQLDFSRKKNLESHSSKLTADNYSYLLILPAQKELIQSHNNYNNSFPTLTHPSLFKTFEILSYKTIWHHELRLKSIFF